MCYKMTRVPIELGMTACPDVVKVRTAWATLTAALMWPAETQGSMLPIHTKPLQPKMAFTPAAAREDGTAQHRLCVMGICFLQKSSWSAHLLGATRACFSAAAARGRPAPPPAYQGGACLPPHPGHATALAHQRAQPAPQPAPQPFRAVVVQVDSKASDGGLMHTAGPRGASLILTAIKSPSTNIDRMSTAPPAA